ncbi:hypothetical protein B0O80DRAFT_55065 [Mortierella sp. GBAus27b]|nr:hypothetical protein BGX31_006641 [Mortierella sp. GBA43]KAI8354291.1 hypothetical protein B0O80DRAFT_55065 [Mortierella sp. GBAus27b]
MPRIELGTPQEKELTNLVLSKLTEYGWADNDVLANFIVVMVANDKSKVDITAELNDILPDQASEFVEWLFAIIDGSSSQTVEPQQQDIQETLITPAANTTVMEQDETMDVVTPRQQRPASNARAPGRLLQSAITDATRSESPNAPSSTSTRQAPSRVYEDQRRERRIPRERSFSPVRSREGAMSSRGGNREERIRFRRTSEERAQDESRIDARLGYGNGGGKKNDGDRLRGRLGRIEDRLGTRDEDRPQSRDRSVDRSNDYHDRRGGRNKRDNSNNRRRDALRDIERRLGTRPVDNFEENHIPRQPASWSRDPERMLRVEAEITRQEVDAVAAKMTRCRFWPSCSQQDTCQYWHPKELCAEFPNCPKTADTCLYIHPLAEPTAEQVAAAARKALMQSMRNNGNNGTASGEDEEPQTASMNALQMPFALGSHPVQECKFGARCTRPDCKFRHPQRESNQQMCRFFPHCTKPNCPFFHPPYGEPLAQKDSTMDESGTGEVINRLPTPCRFGDQCTRPGCHFTHPRDGSAAASNMPLCKFNPCTRPGCPFRHATGAAGSGFGHNRTLVLNGLTKPKVSERFAGGIVDDTEVEKLYVPASAHWANGGVSHQPDHGLEGGLDQATIQAVEAQAAAEMDMDMDVAI